MSEPVYAAYDVIIIGAGISGLVCGCSLARAGMKVLVVEQHDKPGGYCTSFKRGGFVFDAAAHSFGSYRTGGNFREILKALGADTMLSIIRSDPSDTVIAPDFKITFWNDTQRTIQELSALFPAEQENIRRYFDYFDRFSASDQFESIKLKDRSFASFLAAYFTDKRLLNALVFPVLGNGGLPPSLMHAFTGTKIFNEFMIDGGYYPQGGMQGIPSALHDIITQHRGTVLYRRLVKRILCSNNAATGVELQTGDRFTANYVVAACDISQTYQVLLGQNAPQQVVRKLGSMTPSLSTFTLYIGIDSPFHGLPREGTNFWFLPHYDLDGIYSDILQGRTDNFSGGVFMFRVSPDRRTILAFCGAPYKSVPFWKQNKTSIAEAFLDKLERLIPGLRQHIAYFDAATPHTQYRYTLNHAGANYGWAPLQSQLFDPDFRQKTTVNRLYVTGHWTCQTHGIPGVAYLGYNTAKLILRNEKGSGSSAPADSLSGELDKRGDHG